MRGIQNDKTIKTYCSVVIISNYIVDMLIRVIVVSTITNVNIVKIT